MPSRIPAQRRTDDVGELCLSESLALFHQTAIDAQQIYNGRELMLFESQPERIGRLIDLLVQGNYRETACRIVGISSRAIRLWMQYAESGDTRNQAVAHAILVAESLAEAAAVRAVRAAGKDPRLWAAEMTYLERKHPDRWGRRQDDQTVARVVVQIGASASDVRVGVNAGPSAELNSRPALPETS